LIALTAMATDMAAVALSFGSSFPSMPRQEDPFHFLDLSLGYYLTGRFATINGLRIAPNLVHHAVELLIKYTLLKDEPEQGRSAATKRLGKKYKHELNLLWAQYKQKVVPTDLSRFDQVIANLHRWENLRYGGFPNAIGTAMSIGPEAGQASASGVNAVDTYDFGLNEVDELFTAMVAASSVNPAFMGIPHRHTELPEWYARQNQHVMPELFGS
jgi:hypothetical protein